VAAVAEAADEFARGHIWMQQQIHQRPRERGIQVRLCAEVDQHDVARDALFACDPAGVAPRGADLVEEVAALRAGRIARADDLAEQRIESMERGAFAALAGRAREGEQGSISIIGVWRLRAGA